MGEQREWEVEIVRPEVFGVIVVAASREEAEQLARYGPYEDSWPTGQVGAPSIYRRARLMKDQLRTAAVPGEENEVNASTRTQGDQNG